MNLSPFNGAFTIQTLDLELTYKGEEVANHLEQPEKQKQQSFWKIVVGGLLLLAMNWLTKLAEKFTKTSSSNTNFQRSTSESSMDSFSTQSLSMERRSGSNQQTAPTLDLLERDLIGLSSTKQPSFQELYGSNIYDQPYLIDKDGRYSYRRLEDIIGFMICTPEGNPAIVLSGPRGNTLLPLVGILGIA